MSVSGTYSARAIAQRRPGLVRRWLNEASRINGLNLADAQTEQVAHRLALCQTAADGLTSEGFTVGPLAHNAGESVLWSEAPDGSLLLLAISNDGLVQSDVARTDSPSCSLTAASLLRIWRDNGFEVDALDEIHHSDPGGALVVPAVRDALLAADTDDLAQVVLDTRAALRPSWTTEDAGAASRSTTRRLQEGPS